MKRKWLVAGGIALGVALMAVVGWLSAGEAGKYSDATDAFFETLRKGDFDRAYAELSPRRKAVTTASDFRALVDHPAFRESASHSIRRLTVYGFGYKLALA